MMLLEWECFEPCQHYRLAKEERTPNSTSVTLAGLVWRDDGRWIYSGPEYHAERSEHVTMWGAMSAAMRATRREEG